MPHDPRLVTVPTDRGDDLVVREEPLLIEVGGQSVLTMRTPGHDADLALGFLLGEGILSGPEQVAGIDVVGRADEASTAAVDVARVRVVEGVALDPVARERLSRAHAIRASCGLCGLVTAEGLTRHLRPLPPNQPRVDLPALTAMLDTMRARQTLFAATGGCHAAAVFDATGGPVWAVREDVGRHNALDKALGRCVADGRPLDQAVALLSGRAGYELVLKVLRLGVPVLASVSAPSSLAVELAEEHGLTLVCFLRDGQGRVYTDDGRLLGA